MSTSLDGSSEIHHEQFVSLCLSAYPEFAPAWEEACQMHDLDPADSMELKTATNLDPYPFPALYIVLDQVLCAYLGEHYEAGQTNYFPALVERCIVDGNDFVSDWAVVRALEDFQEACFRKGLPDDTFLAGLGPKSRTGGTNC